jgi:16S rRNA pseudouridine516 synthase
VKLVRRLANLGYGSRRDATRLLQRGRVRDAEGRALGPKDADPGGPLTVDGQPMDPRPPLVVLLHKPTGLVTSRDEPGQRTVYEVLPPRFRLRSPALAPVGRLDKDTSGVLLFTDEGPLLHRLTHPRHHVPRVYEADLARDLDDEALARLSAGTLVLRGEDAPVLPAEAARLGPRRVRLVLHEGRYHQVRRMLAAVGNHVEALHRGSLGPVDLGGLAAGAWRALTAAEVAALWAAAGGRPGG